MRRANCLLHLSAEQIPSAGGYPRVPEDEVVQGRGRTNFEQVVRDRWNGCSKSGTFRGIPRWQEVMTGIILAEEVEEDGPRSRSHPWDIGTCWAGSSATIYIYINLCPHFPHRSVY
jgi:hypothetical protein